MVVLFPFPTLGAGGFLAPLLGVVCTKVWGEGKCWFIENWPAPGISCD